MNSRRTFFANLASFVGIVALAPQLAFRVPRRIFSPPKPLFIGEWKMIRSQADIAALVYDVPRDADRPLIGAAYLDAPEKQPFEDE